MKKTKFLLPLFALALTFGVIGCNQSGGNSASSAPTSSKSSIPAKPKITVAAADNKTTVTQEEIDARKKRIMEYDFSTNDKEIQK